MLLGGHPRAHDAASASAAAVAAAGAGASGSGGGDIAVLPLDSLQWERPEAARLPAALHGHSATPVGRGRLLVRGRGRRPGACARAPHHNVHGGQRRCCSDGVHGAHMRVGCAALMVGPSPPFDTRTLRTGAVRSAVRGGHQQQCDAVLRHAALDGQRGPGGARWQRRDRHHGSSSDGGIGGRGSGGGPWRPAAPQHACSGGGEGPAVCVWRGGRPGPAAGRPVVVRPGHHAVGAAGRRRGGAVRAERCANGSGACWVVQHGSAQVLVRLCRRASEAMPSWLGTRLHHARARSPLSAAARRRDAVPGGGRAAAVPVWRPRRRRPAAG